MVNVILTLLCYFFPIDFINVCRWQNTHMRIYRCWKSLAIPLSSRQLLDLTWTSCNADRMIKCPRCGESISNVCTNWKNWTNRSFSRCLLVQNFQWVPTQYYIVLAVLDNVKDLEEQIIQFCTEAQIDEVVHV